MVKRFIFSNKPGIIITKELLWLLVLFVCGFILRIQNVTNHSLWNDEFWTIFYSSGRYLSGYREMITYIYSKYAENPPFYWIFMRLWIGLFGDGELSLRLPSIIFGSISIPVYYVLVKDIFSRKISVLSSILLLFSSVHIYFSKEAKTYSLFFLFSLLSMYSLTKLLKHTTIWNVFGYVLTSLIMIYTNYYGFFLLMGQIIILVKILKIRKSAGIILPIIFLFIPWMYLSSQNLGIVSRGTWIGRSDFWNSLIMQLLFYSPPSEKLLTQSVFIILFFTGILYLLFFTVKQSRCLIIVWFLCPLVIPLLISQICKPIFIPRFALIALSPFILLIVLGTEFFNKFNKSFQILTVVIVLFSIKQSMVNPLYVTTEDWRSTIRYATGNLVGNNIPILIYPESGAVITGIQYYSEDKIHPVMFTGLQKLINTCPEKYYLISRFDVNGKYFRCDYQKSNVINTETPPYLFEFIRLNNI